jgi:hypothetical protein
MSHVVTVPELLRSEPVLYRPGRQHRPRLRLDQPGPVPRHARTRCYACLAMPPPEMLFRKANYAQHVQDACGDTPVRG